MLYYNKMVLQVTDSSLWPHGVSVFITTAFMASHTVLIVSDSFLTMLGGNVRRSVLMASITGVLLKIGRIIMAGTAACPMVAVETEISVMIEACGLPCHGAMAGAAVGASA